MQAIAGIAFALQLAAAWVVGVRLLRLARRTGELPEKLLGTMMLSLMGLGYPLAIGALAEGTLGLLAARAFQNVSNFLIDLGFALIFVFTWRVFRSEARWAKLACVTVFVLLGVHFVAVARIVAELASMRDAVEAARIWAFLPLGIGALGMLWTGFEALRYYALIEKRVALGLATPALANRFLLWGWMGITMGAGAGANLYFLATHIDVVADPRAQSVTSAVGLAQAVLLYLTFLPPRRYARWIETRWGAPRADSAGSRA